MDNVAHFVGALSASLGGWPTVALLLGILAIPFVFITAFFASSMRLGPLVIELRKATEGLDNLSVAMAESRIVELEITAEQVLLGERDRARVREQLEKLKAVLAKLPRT